MKKAFLITIIGLLISLYMVSAADIYVCQTAGCDYSTNNFTAAFVDSNNTDNTIIINGSGSYTINQTTSFNISDSSSNGMLTITSSDIILDCNSSSFDVNGANQDTGYAVYVNGSANNVTIKNCNIADYSTSFDINGPSNLTLINSTASSSNSHSIYFSSSSSEIVIEDVNITNSGGHALFVLASSSNFTNIIIETSATDGIRLAASSTGNLITNPAVYNAGSYGIYVLSADNNTIISGVVNKSASSGIMVSGSDSITINNTNITNSGSEGIYITGSDTGSYNNNKVYSATTTGLILTSSSDFNKFTTTVINNSGSYGIQINDSSSNTVLNTIINNSGTAGLDLNINDVSDCSQNFSGTGNLVDGELVRFFVGLSNQVISNTAAYVGIVNSDNITYADLAINGSMERGLLVCNVSNSTISGINVTGGPGVGIELFGSDENNLTDCRVNNSAGNGIEVNLHSDNNIFTSNNLLSNVLNGIRVNSSDNNTLQTNTFSSNNKRGLLFLLSHNNLVDDNTFTYNEYGAVVVNTSNSIRLFNNTMTSSVATSHDLAVYALNSNNLTLYNNIISTYSLEGLKLDTCLYANISNNRFWDVMNITLVSSNLSSFISNIINNTAGHGLYLSNSDSNTIRANQINNSGTSALFLRASNNNTAQHNTLWMSTVNGLKILKSHTNTFLNNTITNNTADGIDMNSSDSNLLNNNTISYNSDNGIELLNASNNNVSYNYVTFNLVGISLDNIGSSTCSGNNISYNNVRNNTKYDLENLQVGVAVTAENNYWGLTWAYAVDARIHDNEETGGIGAVDFCPLLNDSFANGSSTSCQYPSVALFRSLSSISAQNFTANGSVTDPYFSSCTYRIANSTNASMVWANGSFSSNGNFSVDYEGVYLPVGTWNLSATCYDSYNHNYTNSSLINSVTAILPTISGSATKSGTIGGSNIQFAFNIIAKGYPYIKFYMNLTSGAHTYDTSFASIGNSSSNTVNISGSPTYSGAQTFNLSTIPAADLPSYAMILQGIYADTVYLYITPYSGLSAGTYSGGYGWGLFDS